jgi:hypothetical protein
MDKVANVLGAIVTVAAITAVVRSPHASKVIRSFGAAFSNSISAALGKG